MGTAPAEVRYAAHHRMSCPCLYGGGEYELARGPAPLQIPVRVLDLAQRVLASDMRGRRAAPCRARWGIGAAGAAGAVDPDPGFALCQFCL